MFGPQPTEEEWKVWCNKNKQLWGSEYWCINKITDTVDTFDGTPMYNKKRIVR